MNIVFGKPYLRDLYELGKTRDKKYRFQPQVIKAYVKCVKVLSKILTIEELYRIHSLNYKKLVGNKKGLSAVRINDQYRLEFKEIINPNNLTEIEIFELTDISNHYT
ncbi:MAG: type II toxin-antitoxin system RelE/ParE family toxin [Paludibacter sp.]|jgi:proteic killer suppression protein|nr:type II toxin-antitoxin system RelE/ParE family toxin [Paludibacter sp.]HOS45802.1 type II toxin-antitoxin system RelE/ParE family toxin [Paludibacter sp.]HPM09697.1 type II toxin-antitoxin system RelE/ParE family toxin [Paludibacter sp.]